MPPPPTIRRSTISATAPTVCRWSSPAPPAPTASASPSPIRRRLHRAFDGVRFDAGAALRTRSRAERRRPGDRLRGAGRAQRRRAEVGRRRLRPRSDRRAGAQRPRAARHGAPRRAALAKVASFLAAQGFAGPFLAADARAVHAAGGTPAQELGFALSAAVAYLRALADGGFSREAAAAAIGFRLAADADEFFTLAKFRALRLMWGRVRAACGLDAAPARIHGESAWRTMTARDPYVNVMRGATAAFAAGLGGADSVAVLPHTQALGLPDALRAPARPQRPAHSARRIAPRLRRRSGGRGRRVRGADGGAVRAAAGRCSRRSSAPAARRRRCAPANFRARSAEAAARLADDAARLKALMTGVSAHADLAEAPVDVLPATPPDVRLCRRSLRRAARRRCVSPSRSSACATSPTRRDSATARGRRRFSPRSGRCRAHGRRVGLRPRSLRGGRLRRRSPIPAATIRPRRRRVSRRAARRSPACAATTTGYAAHGHAFARALKAAGARWLALAGRPGDAANAWREAGVDDFLFVGADAVAALRRAWAQVRRRPAPRAAARIG